MGWPTPSFASLTGTEPLSLYDAMFAQVAAMVAIPCTASGSANAITLQPTGNAPALAAYATGGAFVFKAIANSTAAVTVQFMALSPLPLYHADGTTQVTNQIVSGRNYVVFFDQSLNAAAGGYYLPMPQMPGTVGQVLTMGASGGPAYSTPAGTAMVLLNTLTASNSADLTDTTNITGTYSSYEIAFEGIVPVTNAVNIAIRPQISGVFQTASVGTLIEGVAAALASATETGFLIGSSVSNAAGVGLSGRLRLQNVTDTTHFKWFTGQSAYGDSAGGNRNSIIAHAYGVTTAAVTGVRMICSAGNISSGTMRIYGIT